MEERTTNALVMLVIPKGWEKEDVEKLIKEGCLKHSCAIPQIQIFYSSDQYRPDNPECEIFVDLAMKKNLTPELIKLRVIEPLAGVQGIKLQQTLQAV